jgi:hypothetical protein
MSTKYWLSLLSMLLCCQANAAKWGSFNGQDANRESVCLIVDSVITSKTGTEDLIASVQSVNTKSGIATWVPEVCHRQKATPSEIWCDGNRNSPLFGTRYRLGKTTGGTKTEDSESQSWECISGCNSKSPQRLLYER